MHHVCIGSRASAAIGLLLVIVVSIVARGIMGPTVTVHAWTQAVPSKPDVSPEVRAALMNEGQVVYGRDCAECHAEGGIGAALGGNVSLADMDRVVTRILQGTADGAMSAFGPSLTDREIAAVSTFIRNTWDNAFGAIVEADVKRVRDALAKKK
jgi:mono/diheme cytochrome c family protein